MILDNTSNSLNDGKIFQQLQKQQIKEGFKPLTNMSDELLNNASNDISNTFQTTNNDITSSYNYSLGNYNELKKSIYDKTKNYYLRKDNSNPYLNKIIRFNTGQTFYVTNQGVAKYHPNGTVYHSTFGKNGCPTQIVPLDIPWSNAYLTAGAIIPTNPSLVVGTQMKENQACGNEGNNIYVNKIVNEISSKYVGCFKDNVSRPTMKFIGGAPTITPGTAGVINRNFDEPKITPGTTLQMNNTNTPGWAGNGAIENSAWGFPKPYPKGEQCCALWGGALNNGWVGYVGPVIYQTIKFDVGKYNLSFYVCGRPCCDGSGQGLPIDVFLKDKLIYTAPVRVSKWDYVSSPFEITTAGEYILKFILHNLYVGDRSSAIQGVSIDVGDNTNLNNGNYNEDFCKNSAIDQGYKYYSIQNVNTATQKGYCAVSNDMVAPMMTSQEMIPGNAVLLWKSTATVTSGETCTATLTTLGTLNILDSNNKSIFSTTNNEPPQLSEYLGCYADLGDQTRAMTPAWSGAGETITQCIDYAKKNKYKYMALQCNVCYGNNDINKNSLSYCSVSNDLPASQKFGKSTNCSKMADGNIAGGHSTNAIYSVGLGNGVSLGSAYFLLVEDNGNVSIYKGTNLNDKQALIWETKTGGKSIEPNERYKASQGKYASNLVASGFTLSIGDFIGSPSGSAYLIMQSNGNLGLYTSNSIPACPVINNKNMGTYGINAIYELDKVGDKNKTGQLKYVDQDSNLVSYPDKNIGYADTYTKWQNYDLGGWDFGKRPGTVDEIANTCNTTKGCKSFNQDGWYKSNDEPSRNTVYPYPNLVQYIRNKKPIESFTGFTKPVANIDSIQYKNYATLGYDINNPKVNTLDVNMTVEDSNSILSTDKQIQEIANKVKDNNDLLSSNINKINAQTSQNARVVPIYSNKYDTIVNTQLKEMNKSINQNKGILTDSNIVVSHEYYVRIFWFILTLVMFIILMKIILK
jgi:hypothetical protein